LCLNLAVQFFSRISMVGYNHDEVQMRQDELPVKIKRVSVPKDSKPNDLSKILATCTGFGFPGRESIVSLDS
jgi:hypothetical protein